MKLSRIELPYSPGEVGGVGDPLFRHSDLVFFHPSSLMFRFGSFRSGRIVDMWYRLSESDNRLKHVFENGFMFHPLPPLPLPPLPLPLPRPPPFTPLPPTASPLSYSFSRQNPASATLT